MLDDAGRFRTVLVTVGLVALLASAGCTGGGGDSPTTTATATPTETGQTTTGTSPSDGLPPGVDRGGVNESALVAAHDESLSGTSFVTRLVFDQTKTAGNDSLEQRAVQTNRVGPDGTFLTTFDQTGGTRVVQTTWGNGSVAVSNTTFQGQSQYRRRDPTAVRRNLTGRQFITQFVRMGDYSVESRDEESGRVTLTASRPSDDTGLGPNSTVESYDGTVVVGPNGRIERMEVNVVIQSEQGVRTDLTVTFEVVDVGSTTVEKPDWVDEGLAKTDGGPALSP